MTTSYCFFGRATTIVPVTASKSTDEMLKSTAEDISVATGSIPTATRGRRRPSDIHNATTPIMTTPMKLVAKLSWQLKWKRGEDIMISRIRTTLVKIDSKKRFLDNIIDMKCSASYSMACDDIRLPRAEMYGMTDPLYERVCRVLVLREYLPLHKIRSPDDFKVIFIDVVRGMYSTCVILVASDVDTLLIQPITPFTSRPIFCTATLVQITLCSIIVMTTLSLRLWACSVTGIWRSNSLLPPIK